MFTRRVEAYPASTTGNTMMRAYASAASAPAPLAEGDFGVPTQYVPACIAYNGSVYGFGGLGTNAAGKMLQKTGGGAVTITDFAFQGAGNEALRPAVAGIYRERFFYGNFGLGFESAFTFADPFQPTLIAPNALAINGRYGLLNPNDGDRIVAGVETLQTGSAAVSSAFLVLKEFSAFLLTGEPELADGTATGNPLLVTNRMPVNCGCSSPATVCYTPYGIIWAGPDDVWFFPEGQIPFRVGTKIRPILQQSPANVRYRWHAVYHDGFYKLAVHSAGQGPTDDSPCLEQWWMDLRSGPPQGGPDAWRMAHWFGPQMHKTAVWGSGVTLEEGTHCMAIDSRPAGNQGLYSAHITNGPLSQAIVSHDGFSDHDSQAAGNDLDGIPFTAQQNTEIEWELVTKDMRTLVANGQLVADGVMEKGLLGIELEMTPSATGQLGWKWELNAGKTTGPEQTTEITAQSEFVLDLGVLDSGVLSDESTAQALDPAPERPVGRSIQVRLYNKTGYYLTALNNKISFDIEVAPTVFMRISAVLPVGLYADRDTLAAAVATAITAQLVPYSNALQFALTSGLVKFTNGSGAELRFGVGHCDPADKSRVRVLANLLGFTGWDSNYAGADHVTADAAVYPKNTFTVELSNGAVATLYTIPRRLL